MRGHDTNENNNSCFSLHYFPDTKRISGSDLTSITDASGRVTVLTYESNRITSIHAPGGRTTSISYDSGLLSTVTDPMGHTWAYTYDADGNMLTKTDPLGHMYVYTYDEDGRLLASQDPNGSVKTVNYYQSSKTAVTTEKNGAHWTYVYDEILDVPVKITDPFGNITTFQYDTNRNLISKTEADGRTTSYDIEGNLISTAEVNEHTTAYQYDLNNRLIKEIRPDGGEVDYEYDAAGNRMTVTVANGNRTTYAYDGLNRLIRTTGPEGNSLNYTYDAEGNNISMIIKDASNTEMTSTTYTYDILNRLTKTINADGSYTELTYDMHGNVLSRRDENGNITTYTYDFMDRPLSVIDPAGGATFYAYNGKGKITSVTDANGNTTVYSYDYVYRPFITTSPDTGTTMYTYDANGNLLTKKDAQGITTTYVYDNINRLTAIQFPDTSQNITITYDVPQYQNSIGRFSTMTDPSGTTSYAYDTMGRVIMETRRINDLNYRTGYAYDLNGNIEKINYPGGREVKYTYNQTDKISSVVESQYGTTNTLAENITYMPFGDMESMTYGNGIMTTKTYDSRYQLTDLAIGAIKSLTYTRDNVGNITAITDNLNPTSSKSYTYDNLHRLSQALGPWGTITYTHDPVGNRIYETTDTGNTTYTYTSNTNKLSSSTGEKAFSFTYDNNGNTASENSRQYTYNQNQRLIKAMQGSSILGEYTYNGKGQRIKKCTNNGAQCTVYLYDQNGLLISESSTSGTIKAEYIYANGEPLAKMDCNNVYYYSNDHLGTPLMMTDSSSSVVWQGEFKPFGEPVSVTGSIANNLRFPGQYFDSETGLHQNWHRDFKAEMGRYVEADPIGIKKGKNHLYIYVGDNPISNIDPMGLHMVSRPPYYNYYYHLSCIDNHEHPNRDAVEGECFYDPPIEIPNWVCKMGVTTGCNILCQRAGGKVAACQISCREAAALICPDTCE